MRFQPPTVKFSSKGIVFNIACVNLLPDVPYVCFARNIKDGLLFVTPIADGSDVHSVHWRVNCGKKVYPRKYGNYGFFDILCKSMSWFSDCTYTVKGERFDTDDGEPYLRFDLNMPCRATLF